MPYVEKHVGWQGTDTSLASARKTSERVCSVDGCDRPAKSGTLCNGHYLRKWKFGDVQSDRPLWVRAKRGLAAIFIEETIRNFQGDDCLIWPFAKDKGYAVIKHPGASKNTRVHRIACEFEHGPPPFDGALALHTCGKGHLGCVNKKHQKWGTAAENTADSFAHRTFALGERSGAAQLTIDQAKEIFLLRGPSRLLARDLAARFGVSQKLIRRIWRGETWRVALEEIGVVVPKSIPPRINASRHSAAVLMIADPQMELL